MQAPAWKNKDPVGMLYPFSNDLGPRTDFLLYPGENVISRVGYFAVVLPLPTISRIHAVIKIPPEGGVPLLRDCNSLNGTYLLEPFRRLRPQVNYQLRDQDMVLFADLPCQYLHLNLTLPPVPLGTNNLEETILVPVRRGAQFQGTLLAEDSKDKEADRSNDADTDEDESLTQMKSQLPAEGDSVEEGVPGDSSSPHLQDNGCLVRVNCSPEAHEACPSLPWTALDLQPGSSAKAPSSRRQDTEKPNAGIQAQSLENDMENQEAGKKTQGQGMELKTPREMLQREAEGQMSEEDDQEVQNPAQVPKTKVGDEALQELATKPQSLSDSRHQRGLHDGKLLPLEEVSMDDQHSSDVPILASESPVPEAPALAWSSRITQSGKRRTDNPFCSSSSPPPQKSPVFGRGRGWNRGRLRGRGRERVRGSGQGIICVPNIGHLLPQDSRGKSVSSFQRKTQQPFSSSFAPTTSLAPELNPATAKVLPIMADPHLHTFQSWKRGTTRTGGPPQIVSLVPEHPPSIRIERSETIVGLPGALQSRREVVGGTWESFTHIPEPSDVLTTESPAPGASWNPWVGTESMTGSTGGAQPELQGWNQTPTSKEPFPCLEKWGRGWPRKQASGKKDEDEPVETAVKTPVEVVELTLGRPVRKVRYRTRSEKEKALRRIEWNN